MELTQRPLLPLISRTWIGLGILAIATIASAAVAHQRPLTDTNMWLATGLTALAVLAMAAIMAPASPYPRWSHWTSAAVLAGWVIASPLIAGDAEAWRTGARQNLWMMPWFMLITGNMSRTKGGACAPSQRTAWILVAMSAVLGGILMFAEFIARMF